MELNKENVKKIIGIVTFAILLSWGLKNTEILGTLFRLTVGLIMPFLIGGALAFVINVPMRFVERKLFDEPYRKKNAAKKKASKPPMAYRMKRPLSLLISLILVIGVVFIGMFLIVPEIANSITTIANSVKAFPQTLHQWSLELMNWMPQAAVWLENIQFDFNIDWQKTITDLISFLQNGAGNVLNTTFNVAASIFSGLVTGFLAVVFSFYLLLNKEKLGSQVKQILYACLKEEHADYLVRVGNMANRTFSNFLSGQCLEAVILGCMFFVVLFIGNFPYAATIAVVIGSMALIPYVGAFMGLFVGCLLIAVVSLKQMFWFIIVFLIVQQVEGQIIYPRVVGGSVGLPAIWTLFAVIVGGNISGILGMVIFIPIFSVIYALLRRNVYKRLDKKKISIEI